MIDNLTPHMKKILGYIAIGKSYKEVAIILYVQHATVKNTLQTIFNKLGVDNSQSAAILLIDAAIADYISTNDITAEFSIVDCIAKYSNLAL